MNTPFPSRFRANGRSLLLGLFVAAFLVWSAPRSVAQQWVTPPVAATGVQQVVFPSVQIGAPVSYHVYTPPEYNADPSRRFPVLYWLHGAGSVQSGVAPLSAWFDAAIANGEIEPMLIVFPNGLPFGMWCNWANGQAPIEDFIVDELIPEVDARFRTIPSREGRIIEGFSMGGYGAARIGMRHNHLFAGVSMLGAGPLQLDFLDEPPGSPVTPEQRLLIFERVYGSDPARFLAESPWMIAEVHRDELRDLAMPIRQIIGSLDFTLAPNLDFHQRLVDLDIAHTFVMPPDVGHDVLALFGALGESNWDFYNQIFGSAPGSCPTCVPLTDLGAGLYLGEHEGGLYPNGMNEPPVAHAAAAQSASARVTPRLPDGTPARTGLIGVVSIGMSNTFQEFSVFERDFDLDTERDGRIVAVNAAVGGQAAEIIANPLAMYWSIVDDRLESAGLSAEQVQVVYLKQAFSQPPTTSFPEHALALRDTLGDIVRLLKSRFPNLQVCYLTSRSYGGYNTNPLRNEPLSYETGFGVKWLIEDQIEGDLSLNADESRGPVVAPVLLWSAYLWANGETPRSDGLFYTRADYESDGIHPSPAGERKIADLMLDFFEQRSTDRAWISGDGASRVVSIDAAGDATVSSAQPTTNFGSIPVVRASNPIERGLIRFDAAGLNVNARAVHAKLSVVAASNLEDLRVFQTVGLWNESTVTFANGPMIVGEPIGSFPFAQGGSASVGVRPSGVLGAPTSFALVSERMDAEQLRIRSRESGEPARLVYSVLLCFADTNGDNQVNFTDLNAVLSAFGQTGAPGFSGADLNADGVVDFTDLNTVLSAFGSSCD